MKYEIYNVDTTEVLTVVDIPTNEANARNERLIEDKSSLRYIKQKALPNPDCNCGAEILQECVCN